ncbi:carboxylesterase family protein [Lachnospiraceae bacterium CLA-AA-H215]|uniref:Carboxylic ester hydrolase n=1 Tax=Hominifimenecus microfluidus TaxID=2885348 RepID=A0AAE3ED71_9FIRM|nr:carboxylesterase family protein [Hominifimenecus microfluidus]MCC2232769.1 carboxylesterase family protein [Hominifimenecus microfluidus]
MSDVKIVKIETGFLSGKLSEDQQVRMFFGVPYAKPPVGDLRWRAPQPAEPWEGVRDARFRGNVDMHRRPSMKSFYGKEFDQMEYPRSEDCLYLNIWAPKEVSETEKYPIALYFHGGDSHMNKAIFDGEGFAQNGVIMIGVGFRCGVFAGLCHPTLSKEAEEECGCYTSGNYGLLDQIAAVNWAIRNAEAFGGDPERVSVFGQSAGATAVQRLISTPLLKGKLFGAVMQSAGGMDPRYMAVESTIEKSEAYVLEKFQQLGIFSIEEARKVPAETLLDVFSAGPDENMAYLSPKPDGYSLLYSPDETGYRGAWLDEVHVMIGTTKHEGFAFSYPNTTEESFKNFVKHSYGDQWEKYWEAVQVSGDEVARHVRRQDSGDIKMATCYSWVQRQNELGKPAPYVYMFTKEAPGEEGVGAFHSGEHAYVFQAMDKVAWRKYNDSDRFLSMVMSTYWANFFKTGNPNGEGLPVWETTTDFKNDPWVMELGYRLGMVRPPQTKVSDFIKDFVLGFYENR